MAAMSKEEQEQIIRQLLAAANGRPPGALRPQGAGAAPMQGPAAPMQGPAAPMQGPAAPMQGPSAPMQGPAPPMQGPSFPARASAMFDETNIGAPRFAPATAQQRAQPAQAQAAPMQGPVNMNVIKFLNQYANMGAPQEYADKFAGGDLSKLQARTYRDEEGNPYNDYYIKGLLGG